VRTVPARARACPLTASTRQDGARCPALRSLYDPVAVLRLTVAEARALHLLAQGLFHRPPRRTRDRDVQATIERLGVVQIDTISVIHRSQYLVLWSRLGPYDAAALDRLLHPSRAIFEYWGHAASILPMTRYSHFRHRMLAAHERVYGGWTERWIAENPETIAATLARIRENGPMASADFDAPENRRRTGPWDWYGPKDSRIALDALWHRGDLMIHSRRNGQKIYDLRERVLAEAFGEVPDDSALPSVEEVDRAHARTTLRALGVVAPSWYHDYFRVKPRRARLAEARDLLAGLVAEGEAVPATIDGLEERGTVTDSALLADLDRLRAGAWPVRTTLLSPFDSTIWDRQRARALFGFEVVFEAYVPPLRRKYGYYCLAILHRGAIVGRVDLKMDRAGGLLRLRGIWLEPGVRTGARLVTSIAASLRELGEFLGAHDVVLEGSSEPVLEREMQRALRRDGPADEEA